MCILNSQNLLDLAVHLNLPVSAPSLCRQLDCDFVNNHMCPTVTTAALSFETSHNVPCSLLAVVLLYCALFAFPGHNVYRVCHIVLLATYASNLRFTAARVKREKRVKA